MVVAVVVIVVVFVVVLVVVVVVVAVKEHLFRQALVTKLVQGKF